MTNHVPAVAVLMIVNGSLACVMGLIWVGIAVGVMVFETHRPHRDEAILFTLLGTAGVLSIVAGVLNIVGGIRALKYRGRGLVLTALFFNVLPIFTIYCAPTSLGLLIYGLIVMFNRDVAAAFAMGDSGMAPLEIRARFDPYYRWRLQQQQDYERYREERALEDRALEEWRSAPRPPPPPGEPGETGFYRQE